MKEDTYISMKEMIAYMKTGKPFSLVYVSYDKTKGSGGDVKEVQLAFNHHSNAAQAKDAKEISTNPRNPNHFANSTTNIKIPGAGKTDIRKVHYQLIRRFNGAIVK